MQSDGESAVVGFPDGEKTVVGVPDEETTVVTLNFGPVRTKGRPKGQDRFSRFAKQKKLATNTVVGESAVINSCDLCGVCGDIELARESCVNGTIKWVDCDFCKQWFDCFCLFALPHVNMHIKIEDVCNAVNVGV
ncbi:hypothetical protein PoB_005724900 [Plakobranchus ocellatus]|uniref:Uncharacterized protein n=1 Tax=Plakobranchus ocellatus TaxID=259542 RepID=A0AAV4CHR5_9GAST|nr:hypothetical protein PoB_005724900 [Plakobranchus ocellatus]